MWSHGMSRWAGTRLNVCRRTHVQESMRFFTWLYFVIVAYSLQKSDECGMQMQYCQHESCSFLKKRGRKCDHSIRTGLTTMWTLRRHFFSLHLKVDVIFCDDMLCSYEFELYKLKIYTILLYTLHFQFCLPFLDFGYWCNRVP